MIKIFIYICIQKPHKVLLILKVFFDCKVNMQSTRAAMARVLLWVIWKFDRV